MRSHVAWQALAHLSLSPRTGAFGSAIMRIPSPEQMLMSIGKLDCASDGPDIPSAATAIQAGRVIKAASDRIAEFR